MRRCRLGGRVDFQLTVDSLITGTAEFQLSDFDFVDPLTSTTFVRFSDAVNQPQTDYVGNSLGLFWILENAVTGPGTYCAGFLDCSNTAVVMTIRQISTPAPEPASWALVVPALAAANAVRRRS